MKVMVLVKATASTEAGIMPGEQLLAAMMQFNEELVNAGIMQAGEGLHPTNKAKRIQFEPDGVSVVDGPFAETKELVAGFWMWKVRDMDEAVAWAKRMPNPDMVHGELELRPVFEADDFGAALTPELREQEARLRART
jgi:hypothetical protein